MSEFRELLIGCGHSRVKKIASLDGNPHWRGLVTLDCYHQCDPDFLADLNAYYWHVVRQSEKRAPEIKLVKILDRQHDRLIDSFPDSTFDEIHAYEVLEHLGQQGHADSFFNHFSEMWRVLKPGGHLLAHVPSRFSPWLWGDPSHRRAILPETLVFLDQSQYIAQLDGPRKTAMSDFRNIYSADFIVRRSVDNRTTHEFILEAVKPSRYVRK